MAINQWNEGHVVTKTPVFDRIYIRTALFWVITQRVVAHPYRRFGTTYRSHRQRSRIEKRKPETLVRRLIRQSVCGDKFRVAR